MSERKLKLKQNHGLDVYQYKNNDYNSIFSITHTFASCINTRHDDVEENKNKNRCHVMCISTMHIVNSREELITPHPGAPAGPMGDPRGHQGTPKAPQRHLKGTQNEIYSYEPLYQNRIFRYGEAKNPGPRKMSNKNYKQYVDTFWLEIANVSHILNNIGIINMRSYNAMCVTEHSCENSKFG